MGRKVIDRAIAVGLITVLLCLTACGNTAGNDECNCTCEGCTKNKSNKVDASELFGNDYIDEKDTTMESVISTEIGQNNDREIGSLSASELEARRQLQRNLAEQREILYDLPASLLKTQQINLFDKQIIANSTFDFSKVTINFVGDSITDGIKGKLDEDGKYISYTNYINDYLHFAQMDVMGKAGRMFSDYGGEDYSMLPKVIDHINPSADIIVIFLGVNDYFSDVENKRYGDQDFDSYSTAGFCGALRFTAKYLQNNVPDADIFFVTTYNMKNDTNAVYTDISPNPTYGDFMNKIVETANLTGAHVIDLYNSGFMDCEDVSTSNLYLADGVHPNDDGNRMLGEHIAAELVYYYSQR